MLCEIVVYDLWKYETNISFRGALKLSLKCIGGNATANINQPRQFRAIQAYSHATSYRDIQS